jgi:Spy/CpxP family protein refolding chaperone
MNLKKTIATAMMVVLSSVALAQDAPPPPHPPAPPSAEEMLKHMHEKFSDLKLNAAQQKQMDEVFKQFFQQVEQLHKDNPPPPPPPPPSEKVKAQMDKLVADRDEKLKKLLTEEQFKNFKEKESKLHKEHGKMPPPPPRSSKPAA